MIRTVPRSVGLPPAVPAEAGRVIRALALAVALLLTGAVRAEAAEVSARLDTPGGVRYGAETLVSGAVTEAGVPAPGRPVVLEGRRYPFAGDWQQLASGVTGADGGFELARELDRNYELRVREAVASAVSTTLKAYVFPSFRLGFEELGGGRIRITQTYQVPRDVRLRARTRFYIGPQSRRRARLRAVVPTRRVRPGRYRAVARIRIPASYGGRFRYVSCFAYTPGSGMGNPNRRCPRRTFRIR